MLAKLSGHRLNASQFPLHYKALKCLWCIPVLQLFNPRIGSRVSRLSVPFRFCVICDAQLESQPNKPNTLEPKGREQGFCNVLRKANPTPSWWLWVLIMSNSDSSPASTPKPKTIQDQNFCGWDVNHPQMVGLWRPGCPHYPISSFFHCSTIVTMVVYPIHSHVL